MQQFVRLVVAACAVLVASLASAQNPRATSAHRIAWDQQDAVTVADLTYEISFDGGPFGPVLSIACTPLPGIAQTCNGALVSSLTPGTHTGSVRTVRVVDGVRLISQGVASLTFDFVAGPANPTNPRLIVPPGAVGVVAGGTVLDRGPFAGLDVASVYLTEPPELAANWVYVGAARLAAGAYSVQRGDRVELLLYHP